jgi:DNA-binding response OmpR family regulator
MQPGIGPLQSASQDPSKGSGASQSARFVAAFGNESLKTSVFEKPGQILVIEDDPLLRSSVKQFLERRLHTVLAAETGAQGLELARKERPDLILLDLNLPDMDGCEICKVIKADPILQYIPILITTGQRDAATQLRAFEYGANDFLNKPLDFFLLEARVRAMLKYQRAVEAVRTANWNDA